MNFSDFSEQLSTCKRTGEKLLIRLDKFLCDLGVGTRSEVKTLIKKGRVTVDQATANKADLKIDEENAKVCLDGCLLTWAGTVYYILHKPSGVVTATRDPKEKTVLDLMTDAPGTGLFPVGRLDKDTEGLLLVTNDGNLAHRLLSPKKHVDKTYLVLTKAPVTDQMCRQLEQGVDIGDDRPTLPAIAVPLPDRADGLFLTIQEGRFHQVKRMLLAVGNEVVYLKRISMGPLKLDETLLRGSWRALTEQEKKDLGV